MTNDRRDSHEMKKHEFNPNGFKIYENSRAYYSTNACLVFLNELTVGKWAGSSVYSIIISSVPQVSNARNTKTTLVKLMLLCHIFALYATLKSSIYCASAIPVIKILNLK